jgi:hypothetical protein
VSKLASAWGRVVARQLGVDYTGDDVGLRLHIYRVNTSARLASRHVTVLSAKSGSKNYLKDLGFLRVLEVNASSSA